MTTATTDATLDAERYLRDVAPHLGGLPEQEKAELLDDLAQHLREIAAENGPPLRERLGPPGDYAAELVASAGVAADGVTGPRPLARLTAAVQRSRTRRWGGRWSGWRPFSAGLVRDPCLSRRAAPRHLAHHGYPSSAIAIPRLAGSRVVGLLVVAAAVSPSVRLGQRPRSRRLAGVAGNVVLAVFACRCRLRTRGAAPTSSPRTRARRVGRLPPTASGGRITIPNAYDTDRRPLDPVLLRPVRAADRQPARRPTARPQRTAGTPTALPSSTPSCAARPPS